MTAPVLDLIAGVGGAVLGVVAPAALVGAVERALPFLFLSGVGRAEATTAVGVRSRGVR